MPLPPSDPGSVKIKNVSGVTYSVLELGSYALAPNEEIDLLDESIPGHLDYEAAHFLVAQRESEILYQDIVGGLIVVTLDRPMRW